MSLCRQNFSSAVEDGLNDQINVELNASYVYLSMATYFRRDIIALSGFAVFFTKQSHEEREHAMELAKYMTNRGGKVIYRSLNGPENDWKSAKNTLECMLQMEKDVTTSLLRLHKIAEENSDPHLSDYIEAKFLTEQVDSVKLVADLLTNLNLAGGDGIGLWHFDKYLAEKYA